MSNDCLGSFTSNAVRALQRRMSVAPRKRQSATKMIAVVKGQFRTHAPQQKRISFRLFDPVLMHINPHSPDGSAILSAFEAVVV
jgi:hypothetical protein